MQLPRAFLKEDEFRGEPIAYLTVIVSDDADRRGELYQVLQEVRKLVDEEISPNLEWGIWPHFHVRTKSEQADIDQRNVA